jgi:hypothetical protein
MASPGQQIGCARTVHDSISYERLVTPKVFDQAWDEGRAMSLDAVRYAVDEQAWRDS